MFSTIPKSREMTINLFDFLTSGLHQPLFANDHPRVSKNARHINICVMMIDELKIEEMKDLPYE